MLYSFYLQDNISFTSARHTDVKCGRHLHPSPEIVIVNQGSLNMEICGNEYEIPQGSAAFVPPYTTHTFDSASHNKCHVLMFHMGAAEYFTAYLKAHRPRRHIFTLSPETYGLSERLLPDIRNTPDIFRGQAVLAPIIDEIYESCDFYKIPPSDSDKLFSAFVYMEAHFNEPITLESVAKEIGIHPVTLSRGLSLKANLSFKAYLNYLRCSYAAHLIENKRSLTFTEVANRSGFGSIRSFNRTFYGFYGHTPTEHKLRSAKELT